MAGVGFEEEQGTNPLVFKNEIEVESEERERARRVSEERGRVESDNRERVESEERAMVESGERERVEIKRVTHKDLIKLEFVICANLRKFLFSTKVLKEIEFIFNFHPYFLSNLFFVLFFLSKQE